MRGLRVFFPLLLLIAVFGLLLYPAYDARAAVGIKFTSCAVGGFAAPWLTGQIDKGLDKLLKKIPGLGKFFGGAVGGDVPVNDSSFLSAWSNKTLRADILARCTAREIFNAMSKGIVDNARISGRNGGPAFVRNWRNFQTDSQYRGEGIFRAMLSNTKLCDYFGNDLKGLFRATKKSSLPKNTRTGDLDPYALRANCTMPSNFNLASYQKDFAGNGGWNALSRMLEPQNNYYGALFQSLDEVSRQRSLEESADLNQVIANRGFTGRSGKGADDSCKTKDENGKCLEYKDIKTPGTVISDSVAATVQQELAWITNVHSIGEVVSAATEVLLNRLVDLSNPSEGDYKIYEAPTISTPPEETPSGPTGLPCPSGGPDYRNQMKGAFAARFDRIRENTRYSPGFDAAWHAQCSDPSASGALQNLFKTLQSDISSGIITKCTANDTISLDSSGNIQLCSDEADSYITITGNSWVWGYYNGAY